MLSALWGFHVIWHEQSHDIAALEEGEVVGAGRIRIAASLSHIEGIFVAGPFRKRGLGRAMLENLEEISNYYNCHKMTAQVLHKGSAQAFLERCGYKEEAVIAQHTWKLDVAMMRKFLL